MNPPKNKRVEPPLLYYFPTVDNIPHFSLSDKQNLLSHRINLFNNKSISFLPKA